MPDRLSYTVDITPTLHGHRFPAMALLTLVENAVRHGFDPSEVGGHIELGAEVSAQGLRLWVRDDGVGMSELSQPGLGLANLRARLAAFFVPAATLQLQQRQPHGLQAEIVIPASASP